MVGTHNRLFSFGESDSFPHRRPKTTGHFRLSENSGSEVRLIWISPFYNMKPKSGAHVPFPYLADLKLGKLPVCP